MLVYEYLKVFHSFFSFIPSFEMVSVIIVGVLKGVLNIFANATGKYLCWV